MIHGLIKFRRTALALGLMVLAGCAAQTSPSTARFVQVQVSKEQAARAALAKAPGKIKQAELDNDDGKLVWWFDIAKPGSKEITEVNVDADTGGVISVVTELPDSPD